MTFSALRGSTSLMTPLAPYSPRDGGFRTGGVSRNITFWHNFAKDQHLLGRVGPSIPFTRGSGAFQTNSAGVPEYAPENLLLRSQEFDNAEWVKSTLSVTANNTTAPDGTTTADKATSSGDFGRIEQFVDVKGGTVHTWSFYIKDIDLTDVDYAVFDQTNSTNIINSTSFFSSINTSTWTRISVVFTTVSTTAEVRLQVRDIANGETFYLWGAQLERHGSARTYNVTTSAASHVRAPSTNNPRGLPVVRV